MKNRCQFSLRSLLLLMAVLAIAVVLAANRPCTASVCLLVAGPFLIGRGMPFACLHAPQQARWIMAGLVPAYSFACASLCLSGIQNLANVACPRRTDNIWNLVRLPRLGQSR
jgi:hypothetical protein